jgi:hypothetical protein
MLQTWPVVHTNSLPFTDTLAIIVHIVNLAVISTEVYGSWRIQSDSMGAVVGGGGGKIQPLTKQHETRKRAERSKQNTKNE